MSVAALFPERVLVARGVPSLFGGVRLRFEEGPRRFDPVSLDVDDHGLDVARCLSRAETPGQPRRIAALCRRLADGPEAATPPAGSKAWPAIVAAWATRLSAQGVETLAVMPRSRAHPRFAAVAAAVAECGIDVVDLSTDGSLVAIDDAEVVAGAGGAWKTLADAGQGALLAAGLCSDVAAFFVEAAGKDGAECFDKHFDDVARALFVQRIERALRWGFGSPAVRLAAADLVPPLPLSTSRVQQLPTDASPKMHELARAHRALQEKQRAALCRVVIEMRLPSARPAWWQEKLPAGTVDALGDTVSLVAVVGAEAAACRAALVAAGVVVAPARPAWLQAHDVDAVADDDDEDRDFADDRALAAVVMPRAVGGVRATVDFDVGVSAPVIEDSLPVAFAAPSTSTPSLVDPRDVDLPPRFDTLQVRVDDVVIDGGSLDVRGPPGALRARLDVPVRRGSLVVITWSADDDDVAASDDDDAPAVVPAVAPAVAPAVVAPAVVSAVDGPADAPPALPSTPPADADEPPALDEEAP